MIFKPFSMRCKKALGENRLTVELPEKMRVRFTRVLREFDLRTGSQPNLRDGDTWVHFSRLFDDVFDHLCEILGINGFSTASNRAITLTAELLDYGTWENVLDIIEVFYENLPESDKFSFQKAINDAFETEESDWIFVAGRFTRQDAGFVNREIVSNANDLLAAEGFEGAADEFRRAREALLADERREAVTYAQSSYESVMKTILRRQDGNAKNLAESMRNGGHFNDIPEDIRRGFVEQVFNSLPTLGNRLGRHGQGESVVEYPREYAELTLNLAAVFNLFLVKRHIASRPKIVEQATIPDKQTENRPLDEDLPF